MAAHKFDKYIYAARNEKNATNWRIIMNNDKCPERQSKRYTEHTDLGWKEREKKHT